SAELLVEHHVAAARAERDLDRVGDRVHALLERLARVDVVLQFLVSHVSPVLLLKKVQPATLASTSDSRRTSRSSPSTVISVPPYLEYRTSSPSLTSS